MSAAKVQSLIDRRLSFRDRHSTREKGTKSITIHGFSIESFLGPNNIRYNGVPPTNEESIGIIKHSGPTNLKYSTVEARLRTFKDWPPALKQEPRQLADAGFYYIGLSDQTKCFYCDGGLRNWQPDDDPWTEHARWFSKCGYVRLIKGDDFIAKCLDERPPEIASTSSAVSTGSKDKANLSESELRNLMANSSLVKEVLAMGISQARIQIALKQKGKMFPTANELATHALSVQLEEQTIIPNPTESQPNVSLKLSFTFFSQF